MDGGKWRGVLLAVALGWSVGPALAQAGEPTGSAAFEAAFTRAAPRPAWVELLPLVPAAGDHGAASIVLNDVQIRLEEAGDQAIYARRAVQVHAAAALQEVGALNIDFLPAFQRLELHGVAIVRDGQRLDRLAGARVRLLQRETGLERGLLTGAVSASIVVADLRVGDILDVDYTVRGANPVFGNRFFHSAAWDSGAYAARRRVLLDAPSTRALRVRAAASAERPLAPPRIERRGGRTRTVYEELGQQPGAAEEHVPADVHVQRWLQFSEAASWDDVNRWALALFTPGPGGPAFAALMERVRAAGTPAEQAALALRIVQDEVRYLSLAVGENSHRPAPLEAVLERRHGDCKDKSQLLAALLQRLGIDAHVALLSSAMPSGLDALLPSPALFDHVVVHVRIDGRDYLLDPSRQGQRGNLARLGQYYAAHQVLVVRPGTRALQVVGPVPDALPASRRIERFELDKPGAPAELTVIREASGATADALRQIVATLDREQLAGEYNTAMVQRYPGAQQIGALAVEDDHADNVVRLTQRWRIAKPFAQDGERWRVPYAAENLYGVLRKPAGTARRHALLASDLQPDASMEYEMEVRFRQPAVRIPGNGTGTVEDPAFTLHTEYVLEPRRLLMRARLRAGVDRVLPAQLPSYLDNLAKLEQALAGSYYLVAAPMPESLAGPAPVADQLGERLARLDAAIDNAALRGVDASAALCERAGVRQALGQSEQALADAQRAARLQPAAPAPLLCRAEVHFGARRFAEAEADYARAAALGADDSALYAGRALNAVQLGQSVQALAQFKRMLAKADQPADRLRARIWLALLKAPATGAADAGDEAWLAQVLDAVGGGARIEEAIAAATGDGGHGANLRLGETYMYLAKLMQAKGDRLRTRAYFKQTVAKLPPDHPLHYAARHELARIEEKKP